MRTKIIILLMLSALLLSGCDALQADPNAEFKIAADSYTAVVRSLTALKDAGKFTPEEDQKITILVDEGQEYLHQWRQALKDGTPKPDLIVAFEKVLDKLIAWQTLKGGD